MSKPGLVISSPGLVMSNPGLVTSKQGLLMSKAGLKMSALADRSKLPSAKKYRYIELSLLAEMSAFGRLSAQLCCPSQLCVRCQKNIKFFFKLEVPEIF